MRVIMGRANTKRVWDDLTPERGWSAIDEATGQLEDFDLPNDSWRDKWERSWLASIPKQNDLSVLIPDLLWQGGFPRDWQDIKKRGIKCIINVSEMQHRAPDFDGEIINWQIDDGDLPDLFILDAVSTKIAQNIKDKVPTLVHCTMGLNRSGLVNALSIIKLTGWTGWKVIQMMRSARNKDVLCNGQFEDFVLQFKVREPK